MTPSRPFRLADFLLLLGVLVVAAGVRIGYLVAFAAGGSSSGPLVVQEPSPMLDYGDTAMRGRTPPTELDALAHHVAEDGWFGSRAPLAYQFDPEKDSTVRKEEETGHVAPGYPWMLGTLSRWMSADEADALARWLQCVGGSLTAGLYFLFARRVFDSRLVATLAGALTALHPFWIINTAGINDGTATAFLLGLLLFLGSIAGQTGGAFSSLLYGLAAAGLVLLRAAFLPFVFVAMLWLLWRSRKVERGWLCAVLAFLGFLNGLAPWCIRTFRVFDEPVPVVTSTYLHLWQGNNPQANGRTMTEEQMIAVLAASRDEDPEKLRLELSRLPQPQRYRRLSRDVLEEVRAHPDRTVSRRLSATRFFLFGGGAATGEGVAELKEDSEPPEWLARSYSPILMGTLAFMLGLALIAWRWTFLWRSRAMLTSLALIWLPLPYILGHAEFLHGPRLPLDGVLLTFAAFVLACLWPETGSVLLAGPKEEPEAKR